MGAVSPARARPSNSVSSQFEPVKMDSSGVKMELPAMHKETVVWAYLRTPAMSVQGARLFQHDWQSIVWKSSMKQREEKYVDFKDGDSPFLENLTM